MQIYDLPMTRQGFAALKIALKDEVGKPQVYVHIGNEGPLQNQVLRIGTGKNGTRTRWYATSGHEATFLWSIGESDRYKNYAFKYPDYLAFFAGLSGLDTKLCVITCDTPDKMLELEKGMIKKNQPNTYYPVWEAYRDEINKRYFGVHPQYRSQFSDYGGALNLLDQQRNDLNPLDVPVPDVLDFHSGRKWE
jgi:hypothetical protein